MKSNRYWLHTKLTWETKLNQELPSTTCLSFAQLLAMPWRGTLCRNRFRVSASNFLGKERVKEKTSRGLPTYLKRTATWFKLALTWLQVLSRQYWLRQ